MPDMPQRLHRYRNLVCDSKRWDAHVSRPGDIIISTAPKCGTTWMQMICALIVFRSPKFPAPLNEMSHWIDSVMEPEDVVHARYAAQAHRRIIKTHTPLSALPYFPDATYVVVGRDPRDAFLSFQDHRRNSTAQSYLKLFEIAGIAPFDMPDDPENGFKVWATTGDQSWTKDGFPQGSPLSHVESFWAFRHLDNIAFFHYADLLGDLDGEMRRVARHLGVEVTERIWPELRVAASLAAMREGAVDIAPEPKFSGKHWVDERAFFKSGRLGAWRTELSAANQAIYLQASRKNFAPDLLAWAEGGRTAVDPSD